MIFFNNFSLIFYVFLVHVTTKEQWKRDNKQNNPHIFAKCYDDLGCIDVSQKWYHEKYRPVNLEPLDRHTIRTEFLLMKNPKNDSKEVIYDILTLKTETVDISGFKKGTCTKLLIHDFTSHGHTGWIKHIAIAFSDKVDCNIISVDWEAGAEPPFEQAIANARVVALETEVFIKMLKKHVSLTESNIHLIGHGVGAHIAGYVGKNIKGIARITGLDPTGPRFEKMPSIVRLDSKDAKFVEVLHTDAFHRKSQGTKEPMGHADFYLNNAAYQPGCNDSYNIPRVLDVNRDRLRGGFILPACSHKRSFKYFINSIVEKDCKFIGISCPSYKHFVNGSCTSCEKQVCLVFGLQQPKSVGANTKFYLNTDSDPPFCMHTYQVTVSTLNETDSKKVIGNFNFIFVDESKKVSFATASIDNSAQRVFEPGKSHVLIVYAPPPKVNTIKEAKVKWMCNKIPLGFCTDGIQVREITIKRMALSHETTTSNVLCPELGSELKNNDYVQFIKCSLTTPTTTMRTTPTTTRTTIPTTTRVKTTKATKNPSSIKSTTLSYNANDNLHDKAHGYTTISSLLNDKADGHTTISSLFNDKTNGYTTISSMSIPGGAAASSTTESPYCDEDFK